MNHLSVVSTYAEGTSLFPLKALTFYLYTLHGLAVFSVKSSEGELQEMSALEEYSGCKVESRKWKDLGATHSISFL